MAEDQKEAPDRGSHHARARNYLQQLNFQIREFGLGPHTMIDCLTTYILVMAHKLDEADQRALEK